MHDRTPGHFNILVDRVCREDASCSYLVRDFSCLVEDEGQDIFIIESLDVEEILVRNISLYR